MASTISVLVFSGVGFLAPEDSFERMRAMANLTTSSKQIPNFGESNGEWMDVTPGERFTLRVSSDDTNDVYSIFEFVLDHRNGTPMHVHDNEEERFVVLEGTGQFARGDERMEMSAGDSLIVGRGVPHAWCNLSETPLRVLVIFTPGRIDKMFGETIKAKTDEALAALVTQYGTHLTGPTMFDDIYWKMSPRPSRTR
jgi:mannose-6-phosphate isomerase-like protein (cupin superfamily)